MNMWRSMVVGIDHNAQTADAHNGGHATSYQIPKRLGIAQVLESRRDPEQTKDEHYFSRID
jgi:hypothetical protein